MDALKKVGGKGNKRTVWARWILICLMICAASGIAFASSGGGHGEEGAPKGWVATDTYRVMNFVVLAVALFFVLRKPLSQALGDRVKGIKEQLQELEEKKKAAEQELIQYDEKLARLEKEASEIIERYKQQGEEAKKRILTEAESAAEKLQEQARRNMEFELKTASAQLQSEILEKALAKAEATIQNKILPEDQDRLIDEYLNKVEAK
jgi:F-type H+-transporting ATPase subunit b